MSEPVWLCLRMAHGFGRLVVCVTAPASRADAALYVLYTIETGQGERAAPAARAHAALRCCTSIDRAAEPGRTVSKPER